MPLLQQLDQDCLGVRDPGQDFLLGGPVLNPFRMEPLQQRIDAFALFDHEFVIALALFGQALVVAFALFGHKTHLFIVALALLLGYESQALVVAFAFLGQAFLGGVGAFAFTVQHNFVITSFQSGGRHAHEHTLRHYLVVNVAGQRAGVALAGAGCRHRTGGFGEIPYCPQRGGGGYAESHRPPPAFRSRSDAGGAVSQGRARTPRARYSAPRSQRATSLA